MFENVFSTCGNRSGIPGNLFLLDGDQTDDSNGNEDVSFDIDESPPASHGVEIL